MAAKGRASGLAALATIARAASAVASVAEGDLLSQMDWLVPQDAFLRCQSRFKLLRAGNQVGKSFAGLAECIFIALGRHPYRPPRQGPQKIWLVCAGKSQSIAIQSKLWSLVPKAEVDPRQRFDEATGFGGHHPCLRFKNGSVIWVKTTSQGALHLSGSSLDHVLFDEPPARQSVYTEIVKRVTATAGTVSLTLTPLNAPVDYLRELCEAGAIEDLHFELTEANLRHVRSGRQRTLKDGTVCNKEWIDKEIANTIPSEIPVRLHGAWETAIEGVVFDTFDPAKHVTDAMPSGDLLFLLGLDHAENQAKAKQACVLVGAEIVPGQAHPRLWVIGEWKPKAPGSTPPEVDAAAILAMLDGLGVKWGKNLDYAYGDKPVGKTISSKGNWQIEGAICERLNVRRDRLHPRIRDAKRGVGRGAGSVRRGVDYLKNQMLRGNFVVHEDCVNVIEALQKWDGRVDSPHKDVLDALRYAIVPAEEGRLKIKPTTTIRNW